MRFNAGKRVLPLFALIAFAVLAFLDSHASLLRRRGYGGSAASVVAAVPKPDARSRHPRPTTARRRQQRASTPVSTRRTEQPPPDHASEAASDDSSDSGSADAAAAAAAAPFKRTRVRSALAAQREAVRRTHDGDGSDGSDAAAARSRGLLGPASVVTARSAAGFVLPVLWDGGRVSASQRRVLAALEAGWKDGGGSGAAEGAAEEDAADGAAAVVDAVILVAAGAGCAGEEDEVLCAVRRHMAGTGGHREGKQARQKAKAQQAASRATDGQGWYQYPSAYGGGGGGGGNGAAMPSFQRQIEEAVLPVRELCVRSGFSRCAVSVVGAAGTSSPLAATVLAAAAALDGDGGHASSLLHYYFPFPQAGATAGARSRAAVVRARSVIVPEASGEGGSSSRLLAYSAYALRGAAEPVFLPDGEDSGASGNDGGSGENTTFVYLRAAVTPWGANLRLNHGPWEGSLYQVFRETHTSVDSAVLDLGGGNGKGGAHNAASQVFLPAPAPAPLDAVVRRLRRADGLVTFYNDLAFLAVFLKGGDSGGGGGGGGGGGRRRGAVAVLLALPGTGNAHKTPVEMVLAAKQPSVGVVNHRAYSDSEQAKSVAAFDAALPLAMSKREVEELHTEVQILMQPEPAKAPKKKKTEEEGEGTSKRRKKRKKKHTAVQWHLKRSKYDPDHFAFGPLILQRKGGSLFRVFNRTALRAEEDDGGKREGILAMPQVEGDVLPAFGRYVENDMHYYPQNVDYAGADETYSTEGCDAVLPEEVPLYLHYPWVRDNVYHSHNDNFWPLFLTAISQPGGGATPAQRALLLLPTRRSKPAPLPVYDEIVQKMFSVAGFRKDFFKRLPALYRTESGLRKDGVDTLCVGRAVWGRPRRQFSAHWGDVRAYVQAGVLRRWRAEVYNWFSVAQPAAFSPQAGRRVVRVTWLERKKGQRVLANSADLLASVAHHGTLLARDGAEVATCCAGLGFAQQVTLMSKTDVLVGVHGAGLLHVVYLRPSAVAVHLAPPRLPHHEQVIIERMAFAAGVGYVNSHLHTPPSDPGTWHSNTFSVGRHDLDAVAALGFVVWEARQRAFGRQQS